MKRTGKEPSPRPIPPQLRPHVFAKGSSKAKVLGAKGGKVRQSKASRK
jgi:hypothetical protein